MPLKGRCKEMQDFYHTSLNKAAKSLTVYIIDGGKNSISLTQARTLSNRGPYLVRNSI